MAGRRVLRRSRPLHHARPRAWRGRSGRARRRWGEARELCDCNAVAAVGGTIGNLVQEDEIALPLARPHMVQRERIEATREAC